METGISELSFAFALLEELAERLTDVAEVTSLGSGVFEWPRLDGTGVRPGISAFLHFRHPEFMVKSTAAEWDRHEKPYFRLVVPRRSQSNIPRMLRALSELEPETFYVLPLFRTQQELDRQHILRNIIGDSAFIPVRTLASLDDNEHYVTGNAADDLLLDGEPLEGVLTGNAMTESLAAALADDQRVSLINREYLQRMNRTLESIIFPGSSSAPDSPPSTAANAIARLMRIYLGGEAVLLMRH